MESHANERISEESLQPFWRRPAGMAVATAALIAGFYLLREHWGHVWGFWPYLLLLACPLMHLMHGHGGHGGHGRQSPNPERARPQGE